MTTPPTNAPDDKQPIFNIPFVPFVVALGLSVLFYVQGTMPDGGLSLGFRPSDLQQGYYSSLLTHMAVHGGWLHVLMNALGIIAFGAPVARDLTRGLGAVAWLAFFVLCGVLAAIGYSALNWGDTIPIIGASGALFGLVGASLRLLAGPGILIPITHPIVLRGAAAWLVITLIVGLGGSALAGDSARVAWEAHLFGLLAGLVLIGPFHRFFGMKTPPPPRA